MTLKLIDDCFVHDRDRLRHADALAILKARIAPVVGIERVALADAHGRVLAEAALARVPVPAHTNAAVDGYSFAHVDAALAAADGLPIAGRSAAGHALVSAPAPHTSVRIFTGAVVPAGHDTVAMQEDCQRLTDANGTERVRIPAGLKRGANVRNAGEDLAAGETLMGSGARLRPQDVAGLASVGLADVAVFKRLRVAIVSSGDEIVVAGQPLQPGQVYDANAPMLQGLVAGSGANVTVLGVVGDTAAALETQLADAARRFDVILTTGGASQGEEDHLVRALDKLGKRHLWQLAIKPGRPMSFGQIGNCVVVGLPGNPVAAFVCFLMYASPLLGALGGAPWREPRRYPIQAAFDVPTRKPGRREFWRGTLIDTATGLKVEKFVRDGSGLISGLRAADGLIDISEHLASVCAGQLVDFIPFSEFGLIGQ
jgi:molybdopterin molybdotransferase